MSSASEDVIVVHLADDPLVCQTSAMTAWALSKKDLEGLRFLRRTNPHYLNGPPLHLFKESSLRELSHKKHGGERGLLRVKRTSIRKKVSPGKAFSPHQPLSQHALEQRTCPCGLPAVHEWTLKKPAVCFCGKACPGERVVNHCGTACEDLGMFIEHKRFGTVEVGILGVCSQCNEPAIVGGKYAMRTLMPTPPLTTQ